MSLAYDLLNSVGKIFHFMLWYEHCMLLLLLSSFGLVERSHKTLFSWKKAAFATKEADARENSVSKLYVYFPYQDQIM